MNHVTGENEKDFWDFVTGASILYAIFVFVVGALFTLMLFFGKPVEQA